MIKVEFSFDTVSELTQFLAKVEGTHTEAVKEEPVDTIPKHSIDEITSLAVDIMDNGGQSKLLGLLDEFNVKAVTEITPQQYDSFMAGLNKIKAGS